jgi:AraC family transcriptional regulator of adaptative response / DNA-3-methyladenine glycosylase II
MDLDHAACYRALQARDRRFDGRLYVAVRTTGIYCRPICPARTPKAANVRFFASAAAAAEAGFRPCLRCRPEVSPDLASWNGTSTTVARALRLIEAGALDDQDLESLATRLGVGSRHLRRLFAHHLGASPLAVLQTRRVHLAKQLLHETQLPMIQVALAAGFGSVRRFNETFKTLFGRPPTSLRRRRLPEAGRAAITLHLPYSAPYAWPQVLQSLGRNAIAGVEAVLPEGYVRSFGGAGNYGLIRVSSTSAAQLRITVHCSDVRLLQSVIASVRRVFDLAADPAVIDAWLRKDAVLAPLVAARPGLRTVGAWDSTELCWRATLQHGGVSRADDFAARYGQRLPARLVHVYPGITHVMPAAARMVTAPCAALAAVARFCQQQDWASASTEELQLVQALRKAQVPQAVAESIAAAHLRPSDVLDLRDPRLRAAFADLTAAARDEAVWIRRAAPWRPWRAYAAAHLLAAPSRATRECGTLAISEAIAV